ncbi:MAG: hydroxymethylglutaryl-CoA reductase, degradative [Bacteriovoracia bacterium]
MNQLDKILTSLRKTPIDDRAAELNRYLNENGFLNENLVAAVHGKGIDLSLAENFVENAVGFLSLPLGVASNFVIDGVATAIPMATEETSIIAAASAAAKWIKGKGSIATWTEGNWMIGQILWSRLSRTEVSLLKEKLMLSESEILIRANSIVPNLVARGGGFEKISVRTLSRPESDLFMLVLNIYGNTCDAMGANLVNQACEGIKPWLEALTDHPIAVCILSNLTDTKLACAEVQILEVEEKLGQAIEDGSLFGSLDPYRAATNNKGIMNGIDGILIATGNDFRAVEAGAHAFAAKSGQYSSLSKWKFEDGTLVGHLRMPMALGVVGGVTQLHPVARFCLKLMGDPSAQRLARICAAVGLVQNLAALKALCTVGIVKGHMRLHASNLALSVDATEGERPILLKKLERLLQHRNRISVSDAKAILQKIRLKEFQTKKQEAHPSL